MKRIILYFSKKLSLSYSEARGFLGLLMICIAALILIFFPKLIIGSQNAVDPRDVERLDNLIALFDSPPGNVQFAFDPNTLPVDSLKLLGFPEEIAERLDNYRSKNGVFYVKKDIKKIYGLGDTLYQSIEPYILLPDSLDRNVNLDINTSTIGELTRLEDIDSRLAGRIVRYRYLLGGYVQEDQLKEVYELNGVILNNLQKSVYITPGFQPEKIRINLATKEELVHHPYISTELADDIIMFRDINGVIDSEKLLADFKSVDKSNFQKLILYLDFQ